MPSMQSTVILATTLLGSLVQHAVAAAAAPGAVSKRADLPPCIATCMRNSGCFDSKCVCKGAADGILSDIVICMNQWCPADITASDLIGSLEGECDLPKSAVQDAEKKGGIVSGGEDEDEDEDDDETSSSPKPTATPKPGDKNEDDDDDDDDDDDEVVMTFDLGKPQTNPAGPGTTTSPTVSGTMTVATDAAATTGLLTDEAATGSLTAATSSTPAATPSSSAAANGDGSDDSSKDDDDKNAAGLAGQASIFGVVAAMGFALAMGF